MNAVEAALQAPGGWLPLAFLALMGLAMLAYVILDGYDLGVGTLLGAAADNDKDTMVASIGPFWDANETWLVLGVGILLVAFPPAHGLILGALYLPVALMLVGLTLRGVAFDFRTKAGADRKPLWNRAFNAGSVLASLAQGYMLGRWVTGFRDDGWAILFSAVIAVCLLGTYMLLGASWLVMKTEGPLQSSAVRWARASLGLTAVGVAAISVATPFVSPAIFERWFALPYVVLLAPLPLATLLLFFIVDRSLRRLPTRLAQGNAYGDWVPFAGAVGIVMLAFYGLAYSLFPWLVVDRLTIWQAASSTESLWIIFVGACVVLPIIAAYTVFSYLVFRGKATALQY
ncbi:MAG: cytochrome d ubiquinol oxidase subunit II [Rubrivivax sp.]|nr:cytochrome d ubiquinol oxidase subunit II [Rubrivivax sp.]MDP3615548.1 cytochrome d ubiquinol oxidase subunit II [Rubrivivax sp.]